MKTGMSVYIITELSLPAFVGYIHMALRMALSCIVIVNKIRSKLELNGTFFVAEIRVSGSNRTIRW